MAEKNPLKVLGADDIATLSNQWINDGKILRISCADPDGSFILEYDCTEDSFAVACKLLDGVLDYADSTVYAYGFGPDYDLDEDGYVV